METPYIGIVGAGSWGTALAIHLARKGFDIDLWVYERELCASIKNNQRNSLYFPNYKLPSTIHPTTSIKEFSKNKKIIFFVIPSHVIRNTAEQLGPLLNPDCLVINAAKGIENDTLLTVSSVLQSILPKTIRLASISGPTFASEIANQVPSAIVAAAKEILTAKYIQKILSTSDLKVFTSTDILGVELGGALKNVIAIATGISDGLELGFNTRAALITRGLVEIKRIGTALGARSETFSGLSGIGDLVLTCTGELSRNRSIGVQLAKGKKLKDVMKNMHTVAEGIKTVKSAYTLKLKLNIQASIIEETYKVLYDEKSPLLALKDLMSTETTSEFLGIIDNE